MMIILLSFITTCALFAVGGAVSVLLGLTDVKPDEYEE